MTRNAVRPGGFLARRHTTSRTHARFLETVLVVAFFFCVGLMILGKVIFSSGIVAGGDWSTPVTRLQLETYSRNGLFLWTHASNVFGVAQPFVATLIHGLFFAASRALNGPQIDRIFLLFLYTFAGTSVFAYARFIGLRRAAAIAAGTLFVATPVFFNYTAIGWGFVLLAFSFVPWLLILFTRCVKGGGLLPAFSLSLLFTIGFSFASQCIVWYSLTMMAAAPFIVRSRVELWRTARAMVLCGLVFVGLNLFWILPLIRYGDPLLSSAASQSDVPLGQHLNVMNILRGWGSLFNWPYEMAYPNSLLALSLLPPVVGYAALLLRPRDWRARFLATLTLVPIVLFFLPKAFYHLPFTAVIRDVSRFILFQALGSSLLVALTLDWILGRPTSRTHRWHRPGPKAFAAGLGLTLLLSAYPVWAGELTGTSKGGSDIRLRALTLPGDYDTVESDLARAGGSAKALYFPTGMFMNVPTDSRFTGLFQNFIDSYAAYAPRGGGIFEADRRTGEYRAVASFINGPKFFSASSRPAETLGALGIRWIVVRRDLQGHGYRTSELLRHLDTDAALVKRHDLNVVLYENPLALPVVYASNAPVFQNASPKDGLANAFPDGFTERRQVVFFRGSAYKTSDEKLLKNIGAVGTQRPSITFQRVNSTRWDIRVDNATGPFFLVLSETFDPRWHLEPVASDLGLSPAKDGDNTEAPTRADFVWSDAALTSPPSLPESAHFLANGYANAWYINPSAGQTTLTFRAQFAPQALAYVGAGIAATALLFLIGTIVALAVRQRFVARTVADRSLSSETEER